MQLLQLASAFKKSWVSFFPCCPPYNRWNDHPPHTLPNSKSLRVLKWNWESSNLYVSSHFFWCTHKVTCCINKRMGEFVKNHVYCRFFTFDITLVMARFLAMFINEICLLDQEKIKYHLPPWDEHHKYHHMISCVPSYHLVSTC